jgi:hypothetical protein
VSAEIETVCFAGKAKCDIVLVQKYRYYGLNFKSSYQPNTLGISIWLVSTSSNSKVATITLITFMLCFFFFLFINFGNVGDSMALAEAVATVGELIKNYELDANLISTANGWLMSQDLQPVHQHVY